MIADLLDHAVVALDWVRIAVNDVFDVAEGFLERLYEASSS